jgi:hypothetical protein
MSTGEIAVIGEPKGDRKTFVARFSHHLGPHHFRTRRSTNQRCVGTGLTIVYVVTSVLSQYRLSFAKRQRARWNVTAPNGTGTFRDRDKIVKCALE